jgi:beta-phosphoglucomutase-like phosphatase (HAD superfamily)
MLKAIIFDCDGVLLDESYKPLVQELRRHSNVSPGKIERDIVNLEQRFYGAKSVV